MKTYLVQLEIHDDVISTRDKISWSKARRVLLVWPRKGTVLDRQVDLLLLLRHSQQMGAQLAIVTHSGVVKDHARELGIPVFDSPAKAQSTGWRRPRKRKPLTGQQPPEGRMSAEERSRLREQREALLERPVEKRWIRLLAFLIGVLAFLVLVLSFAPGARVELKLRHKVQSLSAPVWASPEIHAPNPSGGLPATVLNVVVEGRDQGQSSGQARVPDQAATGQVRLTNLTDQVVEVPGGSTVLTATNPPIRYLLPYSVSVPAGSGKSVLAAVRAASPGLGGNIPSGLIRAMEGPVGLRLKVENPESIRGGSERGNPAPSASDYLSLKEKLLADLRATALEEMQSRLKPGQRLLEASLTEKAIVEENQEPPAGQPADRFQLALRVEYTAWYVTEDDLRAVSQAALDATLEKGYQPVPGSLRFSFGPQEPQGIEVVASVEAQESGVASQGQKRLRWELKIERDQSAQWSRQQVLRAIQGQTVEEASRILQSEMALDEPPRFNLYPNWWARLPFFPFRIELVIL